MAATLVGSAFLSATVQTLVEKLASTEFRDYIKNTKLNVSLLRQLQTTLLTLQVVLDDAEEKQLNTPVVKQWLDNLKDAVFDAEDLLDQISYDSLRCKVENTQAENKTNQVWNFFSTPFKNSYGEINSQMKVMCENLQLFAQHKDVLGLQTKSGKVSRRTPSSSIVNESIMVGRKDDKEKLMNMLLSQSDTSCNNIGVLAILGMGGVGKTTLAQLLYNENKVKENFDLKAWACVSEDFDALRVTKTLLESITSTTWESNNLDLLRVELKKILREKRFLVVLDDLWNNKYNDWDELVSPLIDGKSGSRVIITTRQQKVAEMVHTFPIHKLELLSKEDCWSILSKHAFGSGDFDINKYTSLQGIGKMIAKKCGGLPIAAKTIGGLLRSKVDANEWTAILNSNIWNFPNDDILPALLLSYQCLPSQLKRCFSYCSIFPKDHPLDRKKMVLMWMAEGFLEHSQGEKTLEEVGDECFAELLSRSLIQQLNEDKYVMHDLVNDLATVISGKSCWRLEFSGNVSENVRHLSYNQEYYDTCNKFEILFKFKCLRSFQPVRSWLLHHYLSNKVVDDLLPRLKRLRVLVLTTYENITMLPDSIGNLGLLRYLDISNTGIKKLPDTICNLYNLQTLILSNCRTFTELPVYVGKLVNLRHLDISGTDIKELPIQIAMLENLQTLTVFLVGKREFGLSVKELGRFPNLQGKLIIKNLHNVVNPNEANEANLKSKENIEELEVRWGEQSEDSRMIKDVFDMLKPSVKLKKLNIYRYGGTNFPIWLGDSSFSNMVSLYICNCEYCYTLPPLGQLPFLKDVVIDGMMMLETIGPEFYFDKEGVGSNSLFQPFPSLKKLQFSNMPNWKQWLPFEGGEFPFPRLEDLTLRKCPELRGHLPNHLSSIQRIIICECDHLLATPTTPHWLSSVIHISITGTYIGLPNRTKWSLLETDSPSLLQRAELNNCDMLLFIPKMITSSTCLQHLTLHQIPSLTEFPADGLPITLHSLDIKKCENLAFLPLEKWSNYTSLVDLEIRDSCHSLTSLALDAFPALQSLSVENCKNLESIYISKSSSSLCPSTLQSLQVHDCKALRSLPEQMDTFTTLESLILMDLPEMELSFCEQACLPPNLELIEISSVRITKPINEWGPQRINGRSKMYIRGDYIVKTVLKERLLLPISLVSLTIYGLSEMNSLEGNGLLHLSSLRTLQIQGCPALESLTKDTLPSSLEKLEIWSCKALKSFSEDTLPSSLEILEFSNCPVLESFSDDTLPSSLKRLQIWRCPLLEARYGSKSGKHWSKIEHIPVIDINDQVKL